MFNEKAFAADTVRLFDKHNLNCEEFYSRLNQLYELKKQVDEAINKIDDIDVFERLKAVKIGHFGYELLDILRDIEQLHEYSHDMWKRKESFYRVRDWLRGFLDSKHVFKYIDTTIDQLKMQLKIANSKFDELPTITEQTNKPNI